MGGILESRKTGTPKFVSLTEVEIRRSTASTLLSELGWNPDLIELQLAHKERNKVRAVYNRAQRLAERRAMVQAWADHIDGLRAAAARSSA